MRNREKVKNYIYLAAVAASMIILLVCELGKGKIFGSGEGADAIYSLVTRAVGGCLCLVLVFYCEFHNVLKIKLRALFGAILFTLPCWAIALNNFPIIPYFSGKAYIDGDLHEILFYALGCLSVGFFEEMAFRGCIFMLVLQRKRKSRWDLFWSIVISSAVFGAIHLVNILVGASPGAVILQVGYSFLIGGMCSIVLMKTGCIWHCVLLHAVYNFCGGVVPELGGGEIWDAPTIILTAVVAVAVTVYMVVSLARIDVTKLDAMFCEKTDQSEEEKEVESHSDI